MTKTTKTRLIRLGDAKRLTKANEPVGLLEVNPMYKYQIG